MLRVGEKEEERVMKLAYKVLRSVVVFVMYVAACVVVLCINVLSKVLMHYIFDHSRGGGNEKKNQRGSSQSLLIP